MAYTHASHFQCNIEGMENDDSYQQAQHAHEIGIYDQVINLVPYMLHRYLHTPIEMIS
jgi:hypothetical protein